MADCHAPPSPRKYWISQGEVGQFVDRAFERSRATLVRDLRGILLRLAPIRGEVQVVQAALSRASLGVQVLDETKESDENLAGLSRVTLGARERP